MRLGGRSRTKRPRRGGRKGRLNALKSDIARGLPFQTCIPARFEPPRRTPSPALQELDRYRLLILRTCKGHKAHEGDGARCRLARGDFFDDREVLSGVSGPHRHDEPATHFKLLNQRRR